MTGWNTDFRKFPTNQLVWLQEHDGKVSIHYKNSLDSNESENFVAWHPCNEPEPFDPNEPQFRIVAYSDDNDETFYAIHQLVGGVWTVLNYNLPWLDAARHELNHIRKTLNGKVVEGGAE